MKYNKQATSILEAIIILLVISAGIVWTYQIYSRSIVLSENTKNKITAISIAREWIEAFTNIRETNWLLFWWNTPDCWNTYNYDGNCIISAGTKIQHNGSYIIYQNNKNKWILWEDPSVLIKDYANSDYKNYYALKQNTDGFFTQTGSVNILKIPFTREIQTQYIDTNGDSIADQNDKKLQVISQVYWKDNLSSKLHKVQLKTVLSNWK